MTYTKEDFFSSMIWEGGFHEFLLEYGVNPNDIEDEELREAVRNFIDNYVTYCEPFEKKVRSMMND